MNSHAKNPTADYLTQWIENNKNDFLVYHLNKASLARTFKTGQVISEEQELRQYHQLSTENHSSNERISADMPKLLAYLEENRAQLPERTKCHNQMSVSNAIHFELISDEVFTDIRKKAKQNATTKEPFTIQLKDGNAYQVNNNEGKSGYMDYQIVGIPLLGKKYGGNIEEETIEPETQQKPIENSNDLAESITKLGKKLLPPTIKNTRGYDQTIKLLVQHFKCQSSVALVAWDMIMQDTLDKQLAKVWKTLTALNTTDDNRKIGLTLYEFRNNLIGMQSAACNMRQLETWGESQILIMRGKIDSISSVINKARFDFQLKLPIEEVRFDSHHFPRILLQPFENNGEFFSIDLANEDTLVIGSQAILKIYEHDIKRLGIRTFNIEDMNAEQLKFFKVPAHLLKKETSVLGSGFFSTVSKLLTAALDKKDPAPTRRI